MSSEHLALDALPASGLVADTCAAVIDADPTLVGTRTVYHLPAAGA